jgi:hypothetical protein
VRDFEDGIHYDASVNAGGGGFMSTKVPGAAARVGALTDFFTFTGDNKSYYRGSAGLLIPSITNTPRIEYDAAGGVFGLLIEGSRTNSLLQSEDFSTTWTTTNAAVAPNQTAAPDGATTADRLTEDATAATNHYVTQGVSKAAAAIQYTASVWLKNETKGFAHLRIANGALTNGAGIGVNLSTGALGGVYTFGGSPFTGASASVVTYANGWYRVILTATSEAASTTLATQILLATGTSSGDVTFNGDGSSSIFMWGAQLETPVAFASSYIRTTTVSVTRAADICTRAFGGEVSQTSGTIFVRGRCGVNVSGADYAMVEIDDGTNNERISTQRFGGGANYRFQINDGGVSQGVLTSGTLADLTEFRLAASYAANDLASVLNASALQTDASATLPTVTTMRIGTRFGGGDPFFGHIRSIDYWPERKSNGFLQQRAA